MRFRAAVPYAPNSALTPSSRTGRRPVNRPSAEAAAASITAASELGEESVTPCVSVTNGAYRTFTTTRTAGRGSRARSRASSPAIRLTSACTRDQSAMFCCTFPLPVPAGHVRRVRHVRVAAAPGQENQPWPYTNSQTDSPRFGTPAVPPHRRIDMRLVGLGLPVTLIVADDVDGGAGALAYFTPALTRQLLSCCVNYTNTALQVANPGQVAGVEARMVRASPGGLPPGFLATPAQAEGKADRAIKPLSIAFGVFGGTTALAALVIAVQVIGRYLRRRRQESEVLRALGASPPTLAADALIGTVGAVAVGSLLAVLVAVALSPLSPLGPVRPFYPTPGISFDWTVLGGGFGALFVGLSVAATGLAVRHSPRRAALRRRLATNSPTLLRSDGLLGLPPPAATGLRFALRPGNEVDTVPMRPAIVGAALAATVLISTITFGASLDHLVSTPRLYGWNWNYALSGGDGGGGGDIPARQATTLLAHDHYLSAWSGVYFGDVIVDGQEVPVIGTTPGATVQPPSSTATPSNNRTRSWSEH